MTHRPSSTSCPFLESFSGTQPHLFVYLLSMSAFVLQQQHWIVKTGTIWPVKPKIFTIWPLQKKISDPCSRNIKIHSLQVWNGIHWKLVSPWRNIKAPFERSKYLLWLVKPWGLCEAPGEMKTHKAGSLLKVQLWIRWICNMRQVLCQWREQMAGTALRPLWFLLLFHMFIISITEELKFEQKLSTVLFHFRICKTAQRTTEWMMIAITKNHS